MDSMRRSPDTRHYPSVATLQWVPPSFVRLSLCGEEAHLPPDTKVHEPFLWSSMLPCAEPERLEATGRTSTAVVVRVDQAALEEVFA